jgi:thioredoxin 1
MKPLTDSTVVSDVMETGKPVVIKFEAKWCAPCKAMTPVLLDIEKEYGQRVQFFTANVEHCQNVTQLFQVSQIPALLVVQGRTVLAKRVGSASRAEIVQWMRQSIPGLRDDG